MDRVNIIVVYDCNREKILMCKRRKNPYKGLYNLVGGKVELNEKGIDAAYRELYEETSISENDISLIPLMDFVYHVYSIQLEVFFGTLNKSLEVFGDENDLFWISADENFFDSSRFAGEGNIGHVVEHIKRYYTT